ncbi:MAG TPA: DUF6390 family protein [Thermoplasmata archaeon]|nr:DUF6390 family protein [Thermoplasmata archaeon]
MDGVALASRFSLATNRLNFCGPADAEPKLYQAITTGADLPSARRSLERFEALMPYLEAIGRHHGLDPFDSRVVEAYWLGNELLDGFDRAEFEGILSTLVKRGLPKSVATRLSRHLPARPLPFHMFHVAYVGVGAVTGHVPTTLPNMESCRPSWGTVVSVEGARLRVRKPSLEATAGRLSLSPEAETEIPFDARVLPGVKPGESVALHWGWPALVLSSQQRSAVERYTQRSLDAVNEVLPGLGIL